MYKTFGETIASLRRAHGMRQQALAEAMAEAGMPVSNQAVSKWENDATLPNAQQFLTLCRVLDVDDIAGTFSGGDAGGLLAGLNAEGRRRALEYIALLRESKRFAAAPEVPALRSLPLYSLAVSAGTGQFLDGESYEMQPVGPEVPEEANFGVRVAGDSMEPRMAGYYTALGKAAGAVIKRVPAGKLQKLCGTQDHQGVAAWAARIQYVGVEELLQIAKDRGEPPFLVLCDGIEDPHNLGAILRSALLCGAHGVIIPRRGGVGVTGTVMKASAGAAARLPIARVSNLAQAIRTIKEHNIFVYCADLGGAPLAKTDLSGPVALVLGSEGGGPGALTRKLCDAAVTLEMAPGQATGVDSYNVSVAAGILCYDVMRRRLAKK